MYLRPKKNIWYLKHRCIIKLFLQYDKGNDVLKVLKSGLQAFVKVLGKHAFILHQQRYGNDMAEK